MANPEMDYQQALEVLLRMKSAAPTVAAAKIGGVIALLEKMRHETDVPADQRQTLESPRTDAPPETGLLSRLRDFAPAQQMHTPVRRANPGESVAYVFQDFDPEQFSIENMPADDSRFAIRTDRPDTGELFADLPEFGQGTAIDPSEFTLGAALGISVDHAPPARDNDLLSVMGLDADAKPALDLFAGLPERDEAEHMRDLLTQIGAPPPQAPPPQAPPPAKDIRTRSQLLRRIEPPEDTIGMEDVTGLLRGSDQVDVEQGAGWSVTDVLADLGVERSAPPPLAPPHDWQVDAAALVAAADAFERGETANEPTTLGHEFADDSSGFDAIMGWNTSAPPAAFGVTAPLSDAMDAPLFGATDKLPPLEDEERAAWGVTAPLSPPPEDLPDLEAPPSAWRLADLLPDPYADSTRFHDWDGDLPPPEVWTEDAAELPPAEPTRHHDWDADVPPADAWGDYNDAPIDPARDATRPRPRDGTPHPDARHLPIRTGGVTDRLDQAAWNSAYQPPPASDMGDLFGSYSADGGLVPDEYAIYDATAIGGQQALDQLVAFAHHEAPARGTSDLPGAAALLTNVREVLKPSLLLLRAQTDLLRERAEEALDERDAEMVRLMQDNADLALTLLESLEMVMQLSENALDLEIGVFSPLEVLREAGEKMQDRARLHRHRITVMLDRRLPRLRADYKRTLAILVDLMDNAVRYTPEGGSSRIAVDHLGGYVLFTVADNGVGLSDADLHYVGQPFWRGLHQPLVRAHRGTGLRLYLARRVLEMQGGALFFSGEPGAGSTFSFTVPVAG